MTKRVKPNCRTTSASSRYIDIIEDEIKAPHYYRAKGVVWRVSKKVNKGAWGMPRLLEAKKDVVSCEKLWGFANEI